MTDTPDQPDPPTEPATSFKWVIVVAVIVWGIGAAMIFLGRL